MADTGEPTLRQEDFLAFLKGYAPDRKRAERESLGGGRWRILINQPLNQFSSDFARAYVARDEQEPEAALYALVFENDVPLRQKNITALKTFRHPAMVSLLAEGTMETGAGDLRYACVLTRPEGQLLSQLLLQQRNQPVSESTLMNLFLRPLAEVVIAITKLGVSHNRINPGNIYVNDGKVMLGECIGEPSGYSQTDLYEPVERLLANSLAKADYAGGADCYALAILTLRLALGFEPYTRERQMLIDDLLDMGAYHTLVMPWDLPHGLQDLFRGVLNDGKRERWDAATLESWLNGRRFNLVLPSSAREASRGFDLADESYFSRRSLAGGLAQHWAAAKSIFADSRLVRWVKSQAHKAETADAIARIAPLGATMTPQQEDDALARIIILLDSQGPIRFKQIAVAPEGIGTLLADAVIHERNDEVRVITQILDSDLCSFWIEQQKVSPELTALPGRLQKARGMLHIKGLGFGLERCLYDLNPGLACQSPLVARYHATSLGELMSVLDSLAPNHAGEDFSDRHIAAFLASRLGLKRELALHELQSLPALMKNPNLAMLRLLAQAQHKSGLTGLKGLTHWFAARLLPLVDVMHNRPKKRKLLSDLRTVTASGSLERLEALYLSPRAFDGDKRDFDHAVADYAARKHHIAMMQSTAGLSHYAGTLGRGVAQSVAYSVCLFTVYLSLKSYFHL